VPPSTGSLFGVQALVAAPILDRQGSVIGALYGDRSGEGDAGRFAARPITNLQAKLVQLLASGVAAGLAQKKLVQMERDLEIGREIQAGFLPKTLPEAFGWEVAAHFRPAREVSGDFYDAFSLPGGHLVLVIADVCDKGVGAALYMTLIRSLLRAFAEQAVACDPLGLAGRPPAISRSLATEQDGAPLAELITRSAVELTNNYVAQTHGWQCMFCTLFFGVLDTASGALTYINAGHDAPALLGAAGKKTRLTASGPVVGINPNVRYKIDRVFMEPGDTLFAYTDGVTEAREPGGRFFTETRLLSILHKPIPSATAVVDNVIASLLDHISGAEPHDDVTILAVRRMP
jgi:sigma-B regulation protein RsbU (phosphoserine phosphatase)